MWFGQDTNRRCIPAWSVVLLIVMSLIMLGALPKTATAAAYQVQGVAADDYLNMRAKPGVGGLVVTMLPPSANNISLTGERAQVGSSIWVRIKWQGKLGWVNRRYLALTNAQLPASLPVTPSPQTEDQTRLRCGGTEPFWGIDVTNAQATFSPAGGEKLSLPIKFRSASKNNPTIAAVDARNQSRNITMFLQKVESCSDGMSDVAYPFSVTAIINNDTVYSGCCHKD